MCLHLEVKKGMKLTDAAGTIAALGIFKALLPLHCFSWILKKLTFEPFQISIFYKHEMWIFFFNFESKLILI